MRLGRAVLYPSESIRSVTLVAEAGRLHLDVTAEVPVAGGDHDPARVAGIDLGIIHPYAVMAGDEGLLVSGRAIRAEERLHLEDTKRRAQKAAAKAPSKGQKGSRRWRRHRASRKRAEARHRRRVRQAHHEAAKSVVSWLVDHEVGTVVVGDPKGIATRDCGRRQNLAIRNWRRTHLLACLSDKAELAGIKVVLVNERGTSSTCPECHKGVPRPRGGPSPGRGDAGSPARTAGIGATETSSVPETSPPGAADPRVHPHASRTVGPGDPRHGVTGAVTSSTCAGPARHRAARGDPGVARRGIAQEPDLRLRGWPMPSRTAPCEDRSGPAWTCVGSMLGCTICSWPVTFAA